MSYRAQPFEIPLGGGFGVNHDIGDILNDFFLVNQFITVVEVTTNFKEGRGRASTLHLNLFFRFGGNRHWAVQLEGTRGQSVKTLIGQFFTLNPAFTPVVVVSTTPPSATQDLERVLVIYKSARDLIRDCRPAVFANYAPEKTNLAVGAYGRFGNIYDVQAPPVTAMNVGTVIWLMGRPGILFGSVNGCPDGGGCALGGVAPCCGLDQPYIAGNLAFQTDCGCSGGQAGPPFIPPHVPPWIPPPYLTSFTTSVSAPVTTATSVTTGTYPTTSTSTTPPPTSTPPSSTMTTTAAPAKRGVFGGGSGLCETNVIQYIDINTLGDAQDFGDLTVSRYLLAACSSATRGVFTGGCASFAPEDTMDYITIATAGDAVDFGNLTDATEELAGFSNSTRGVFGGGDSLLAMPTNVIEYITIATTGNATDFGDLTLARDNINVTGCASTTRGLFAGGLDPFTPFNNIIDYVTIATPGNATDFGDLLQQITQFAGLSSNTRAIWGGGAGMMANYNIIEYVEIATLGDAVDFGDLLDNWQNLAGTSNGVRGVFGGGDADLSGIMNVIQYITITTLGDAADFGDLLTIETSLAALSDSHGGLP